MARNRPDRTREDKSAEILAIARRHLLEAGYEATTIASIAREAGIAPNVVHWYFPTKDDLFVAVLDSLQTEDLADAQKRFARVVRGEEAKAFGDLLTEFALRRLDRYGLLATLHERSHTSAVVAGFHDRAHRRYAEYLGRALDRFPVPTADRKLTVDALIAAVESLVMHRATRRDARRMMTFLAERLVAAR